MRRTTQTEVRIRRDGQEDQGAMWSYVPMERRIPADHPLRAMRRLVAPEKLSRALVAAGAVRDRSERH
jgi:hypothetical protein